MFFYKQTVGELKAMALSKFGVTFTFKGGRLRVDDETVGLRAPCMYD